jgi:hypothetical protein
MPHNTANYITISNEMLYVAPLPIESGENGQFRIAITSDKGKTKWINISSDTFKQIERILLESVK